jgi:hypothetical protein
MKPPDHPGAFLSPMTVINGIADFFTSSDRKKVHQPYRRKPQVTRF